MTDEDVNKLRTALKEEISSVIKEELKPVNERLGRVEQRMDVLWDQTVKITENLEEINDTLKSQTKAMNNTNNNIEKVDKRLIGVEGHLGIVPPPELTITR